MSRLRTYYGSLYTYIVLGACVIMTTCYPSAYGPSANEYYSVRFHTIGSRIPIVKLKLNCKDAWFIVDTCSTITLLNSTESDYFGVGVYHTSQCKVTELKGLNAKVALFNACKCIINFGTLTIKDHGWKSSDRNDLFLAIRESERIKIAGILGSDILAKYDMEINYADQTISYPIKHAL